MFFTIVFQLPCSINQVLGTPPGRTATIHVVGTIHFRPHMLLSIIHAECCEGNRFDRPCHNHQGGEGGREREQEEEARGKGGEGKGEDEGRAP